jgi:hypothetical protein
MQIRRNSNPLRETQLLMYPLISGSDRAFLITNFRPEPIPGTTEPTPDLKSSEIVASAGERSTEAKLPDQNKGNIQ